MWPRRKPNPKTDRSGRFTSSRAGDPGSTPGDLGAADASQQPFHFQHADRGKNPADRKSRILNQCFNRNHLFINRVQDGPFLLVQLELRRMMDLVSVDIGTDFSKWAKFFEDLIDLSDQPGAVTNQLVTSS